MTAQGIPDTLENYSLADIHSSNEWPLFSTFWSSLFRFPLQPVLFFTVAHCFWPLIPHLNCLIPLAWSPTLIARLDSKWFTLSRNKFLRIVICKVWPWASNISITWELIRNTYMHAFQSCLTFGDPIDCSPPGFSVHGILQVRILEWVAVSFSKKHISCAKFNGLETLGVELNNLHLSRQS